MKLSNEIIEVLDYLGEKFGIAIDWTDENVLPYIQDLGSRYIKYEISTSVVWIVLAILLLCLTIVLIKHEPDAIDVLFPIIIVVIGISILTIIFQTHDIIRSICIPEMQIYQYISKFIE